MVKPGTSFQVIPEGDNHFWIVISPEKDGCVLAVNTTDAAKCPDSPCKINVGDHPSIVKPSAIYYKKAREFSSEKIEKEIAEGKLVRRLADFNPGIVQRIIDGAKVADDLTLKLLKYLD